MEFKKLVAEDSSLDKKLNDAIWIANSLFERGKATGSSANMSFKHEDNIFITGSGTSFGTLKKEDFSVVTIEGEYVTGIKPSKEFPLHQMLYKKDSKIEAVIHTHSFYSTMWSCIKHENETDCIPEYTPYLKMKVGTVGLVQYAKPGSKELFDYFQSNVDKSDAFLLSNHGPIVAGKSLFEAFYGLEELEESTRIAWEIENRSGNLEFKKI